MKDLIERLTAAQRDKMPPSSFVFPDEDGKGGRWPIQSPKQAMIAITFMKAKRGEASDYPAIKAAIAKKYKGNKKVLSALQGITEAKASVTMRDIASLVSRLRTTLELTDKGSKSLTYMTRAGWEATGEGPSRYDLEDANDAKKAIMGKFGNAVSVDVDTMDEYVVLTVSIRG